MQNYSTPKNSIQQVYGKIILLALLTHVLFVAVFLHSGFLPLVFYNIFSILFYIGIYLLCYNKHFRGIVILIHLEICLFVTVSCYFLGWDLGFPLYLIALSSLVYFCPFKRKYIPYLFSLFEVVLFLSIKIYTLNFSPVFLCSPGFSSTFYIFNSGASFTLIIYAAYISKVSAVLTEQTLTKDNSVLQDMVAHDALTKLWTRRHLTSVYKDNVQKQIPLVIVLTDIDNFKRINDTYGHECGDYVLSEVSQIMLSNVSKDTVICRWGGEEFVIMMPDMGIKNTISSVEAIRCAIDSYSFRYNGQTLHITMTFGVSTTDESTDMRELIRLADSRMYTGKQSGKNTIITKNMKYPNT